MKTVNNYTETDLGNVSPNPRGEYDNSEAYEYLDLVSLGGGSYLCLAELGQKITGIAPEPGETTEYWQCIAVPGEITEEYTEIYADVKRLAKQANTDAENALQARQGAERAQQSAEDAANASIKAAQESENSKDSSAGYMQRAETAAQTAESVKGTVENLVNGFDEHVASKATEAEQAITTAKDNAVSAVTRQEKASVQEVKDQTASYITEQKNLAKQEIDDKIQTFDVDVNAIKQQVANEGTKQVQAVQAKGQEVINSIPQDFPTQMATKLDKQQGTENAGKALVVGKDGNVVPGEVQNGRMKLLVRYTHKANGSMELSNLDLQTGTFTTSEPHGLKENTALYIKPLAGCLPKHIPIEIFKNNPGQWGRGNIYAHVIDDFNFQVLSKKDGDILQFTNATNSEVDVKYFTFEYNMKKITLDNINCRVIDIVANGMCSGGYFAVKATTNYGNTYSTRTSSNTYSFFSTGQTPAHYHYACRMMFDKGIVTATIPIVAMSLDGTSYSNNNVNKIGRMYTRTVFGMGMEANPNAEKENGYIKSIHPFAEEVYPFNGAYVEIWGYDE